MSAFSTLDRCAWTAVNFKDGHTRKRKGLIPSNKSWKSLGFPCLGDSKTGHRDLGQVLPKLSMQMCVCVCVCSLNIDEVGNRIRLLSSPWVSSCTSQGHVPSLYCRLSAAHFSSAKLPPKGAPPLQHIHHSPYLVPFPDLLCSPLNQLKNDAKVPCPTVTSLLCQPRLRWGDSDYWSQSPEIQSSFKPTHLLAPCVAAEYTLLKALLKLSNIRCSSLLHRVCHHLKEEIKYQRARHNLSCKFPLSFALHLPPGKTSPSILSACGLKRGCFPDFPYFCLMVQCQPHKHPLITGFFS